MMKRFVAVFALVTVVLISTAVAGKRIRNHPRDGTGPADATPSLRPCRSPLVAGGEPGARWIKATVQMDAANALALLAEVGDFNVATAIPILATSLGHAAGTLPDHLDVTIEVRAREASSPR